MLAQSTLREAIYFNSTPTITAFTQSYRDPAMEDK